MLQGTHREYYGIALATDGFDLVVDVQPLSIGKPSERRKRIMISKSRVWLAR